MTLGGTGTAFSAGGGVGATGTLGTSFSIDGNCFGGAGLAFGAGAFGISFSAGALAGGTGGAFSAGAFLRSLAFAFSSSVCGAAFG